jgi:hypothetical protein
MPRRVPLEFPDCGKGVSHEQLERMFSQSLEGEADFVYQKTLRVGQSRILRTRPIFRKWSIRFVLKFDNEVMEKADVLDAMRIAGTLIGIGDWRPKFGTFVVEEISERQTSKSH